MYCPNCGKEFGNGAFFCPDCGYSVMQAGNNRPSDQKMQNQKMRHQNQQNYQAGRPMGNPYQQQNPYRGNQYQQGNVGGNPYPQRNSYGGTQYQQGNMGGNPFSQQNINGGSPYQPNNGYGGNPYQQQGSMTDGYYPEDPSYGKKNRKGKKIWILIPILVLLLGMIAGGTVYFIKKATQETVPGTYEPEKKNLASEKEESLSNEEKELPSLEECKVGQHIYFGEYEQDNNTSNGKGAIEWIILDKDENGALIITKDCIDACAFHTEEGDTNWEKSTIRTWLNTDFRQEAFQAEELSLIECRTIENKGNSEPDFQSSGSEATQDSIFLLSQEEVQQYMDTDAKRKAAASKYAESKGLSVDSSEGASCWWLRTPGFSNEDAAHVMTDGTILASGSIAYLDNIGVRPAMWITMG